MGMSAAVAGTVLAANETRKANKENRKLSKEQKAADLEARRKQGQDLYATKANEYADTRSKAARSKQRGRMSTILGSGKGTL